MKRILLGTALCAGLYVAAFIVIHRSSTLRQPAANMAYWYYSDNSVIETVEYYGFWPLRRLTYHVAPEFMSRHNSERIYPTDEELENEGP
jgi:hypothetical protein